MDTSGKGSEFRNIIETWEQNERDLANGKTAGDDTATTNAATTGSDLDQVIKQEATEYDNENKENRVLSGDRATVNDDAADTDSD